MMANTKLIQVIANALICHIQARLSGVQVPGAPRHPATHRRSAHGEGGSGHRTHAGPQHRPRLERPTCRRHALGAAHEARGQPSRNRRGANRDRRPAHRRGSGHMRALNALPSLYLSHPTHRRCSRKGGRPVCAFRGKVATDSDLIRPPIPRQNGQSGWSCDRVRWVILTGATLAPFQEERGCPGRDCPCVKYTTFYGCMLSDCRSGGLPSV